MPDPSDPSDARPTALAVVGLSGGAMRYAEVEPGGPTGYRLRRLGTCDFDLDAEAAVFGAGPPEALAVVADALRDVFAGTSARSLVVATPATATTTFFTPLPAGLGDGARDEQLRQEAALLADVPPATPVRVRAVPVRAETMPEGERRWYHVLHVGENVHARLGRLAAAIGAPSYDVADAGRAAATVVRALPADGPPDDGADAGRVDLVVGAYAGHTEVAVVRGGDLLFGHHGPGTTPEDTAYFALAALEAAGLGKVSRMPQSLRIVLESVLRNCDGKRVTEEHVRELAAWKPTGKRTAEIPFVLARILLQDM
ncbi:MAG TPA: hypothetical protein VF576_01545, partial [Rubricoccaceae bacterium]